MMTVVVVVVQEVELLEYIDAEELPPLLVDLLDKLAVSTRARGKGCFSQGNLSL